MFVIALFFLRSSFSPTCFIFPLWQNGGSVASQFCDAQNCVPLSQSLIAHLFLLMLLAIMSPTSICYSTSVSSCGPSLFVTREHAFRILSNSFYSLLLFRIRYIITLYYSIIMMCWYLCRLPPHLLWHHSLPQSLTHSVGTVYY
jgi:hypothetical protein